MWDNTEDNLIFIEEMYMSGNIDISALNTPSEKHVHKNAHPLFYTCLNRKGNEQVLWGSC